MSFSNLGFGPAGFGFGRGNHWGVRPYYVTDLFNILQSSPTYTGGPLTATDYEGNLVTSPAGVPALEGGRLATTVAEGAKLGPELFPTVDLTTWITAGTITTETVNTFTSSGPAGKALAGGSLTIAKRYQATLTGTSSTVLWSLKDSVGTGTDPDVMSTNGTVEFVSTKGGIYFRNTNTGTFTLGTLSVREVIPTWYDTELDGTPIQPSISIPTRSGTKKWYQEPFASPFGYSNWPARTNKCTCRKFNPVDTTNITKSGDAAAVLSVVDDTAALTAAGLIGVCTSGKVYKLDNSAGVGEAAITLAGVTGNTNSHSAHIYARATSGAYSLCYSSELIGTTLNNAAFERVIYENKVPANASQSLKLRMSAGAIIYFILPQLEEGAFATPPIFDPLNDSLTSITRAATNLTLPTQGVLPVNDFGIWGEVIPGASGQGVTYFLNSLAGAGFELHIRFSGAQLVYAKDLAPLYPAVGTTYIPPANTPFQYQAFQSRVYGMGTRVKQQGGAWSAWTLKNDADGRLDAAIATTYQVGATNNASHFAGYYPGLAIIQHADPKAELERLTLKYGA